MERIFCLATFVFAVLISTPLFAYENEGNLQWSNKATNKMNWNDAINYCKNLNEGGHNEWRLPNIDELRTLIQNHSGTQSGGSCPISENAGKLSIKDRTSDCNGRSGSNFSKLGDTDWFWSSSTLSDITDIAWYINFGNGDVNISPKRGSYNVRCVMSKRTDNSKNNTNNPTATPSQSKTTAKKDVEPTTVGNLMWSHRALYKSTRGSLSWDKAVKYCKNLNEDGYTDWRLPNIDELRTLLIADRVSNRCRVSEINNCLSKDCWSCSTCTQTGTEDPNNQYKICSDFGTDYSDGRYSRLGDEKVWLWSSSTLSDDSHSAAGVDFGIGAVAFVDKLYNNGYVRCVRNPLNSASNETAAKSATSAPTNQTKSDSTSKNRIAKAGNLQWSHNSRSHIDYYDAVYYCKNMKEGGYSDWRLPNIDELRTLIQNHSGTQSGGSCPISENAGKLSSNDWTREGCSWNDVTAEHYSKLGDTGWFWSSSPDTSNPDKVWCVNFNFGGVSSGYKTDYDSHVRCVR